MANPRFILRFKGKDTTLPEAQVTRLKAVPGVRVVDRTGRMLLVESPSASKLKGLIDPAQWLVQAEQKLTRPDPRPRVKKSPPKALPAKTPLTRTPPAKRPRRKSV